MESRERKVQLASDIPFRTVLLTMLGASGICFAVGMPLHVCFSAGFSIGMLFLVTRILGPKLTVKDFGEFQTADPIYQALDPELVGQGLRLFTRTQRSSGHGPLPFAAGSSIFIDPEALAEISPSAQAWLAQITFLRQPYFSSGKAMRWIFGIFWIVGMASLGYTMRHVHETRALILGFSICLLFIGPLIALVTVGAERRARSWVQAQMRNTDGKAATEEALEYLSRNALARGWSRSQLAWTPGEVRKLRKWAEGHLPSRRNDQTSL